MYLYMHVCPNGKKYIGITMQEPNQRWRDGKGYCKNKHFYNAILKYGWNNIQHIILFSDLTEDEANEIEEKLIDEMDLTNPENGYNLHTGGRHHRLSKEARQKISNRMIGVYVGDKNPFYGRHHTEESLAKFRKRVEQYSIDGEYIRTFDSLTEASEILDVDKSSLSKACKGTYKTYAGYQWKLEGSEKEIKPYKRKQYNAKKVAMFNLCGEKLAVFESLTDAGRIFGVNGDKCIGDCCRGEQKTAYGYVWRYE